jgi:hypothetical protein
MSDELSIFDQEKNYYVFKYVVDKVSGDPTEYEGEIMAYTKATDPWEAVSNAGFDDCNAYGANRIDDLNNHVKAIADERKHLKKVSKQLKEMTDERDEEQKKFMEDRLCPNGCGKMDEAFRCGNCGFGHEKDELVKDIDRMIKEQKKAGEDTSELEGIKKSIEESIAAEDAKVDAAKADGDS